MKESDKYYLCYEKLMKTAPEKPLAELSEYKDLLARYPHIAESIRLRREIEKLEEEARSAKDRSAILQLRRQINDLTAKLKRQDILKRLHGEGKQATDFWIRFSIGNLRLRLSSPVRKVCSSLQEKLQEQSRRSRLARAERFPPSLFDLRSLDTADRSLALREWIEKRKVRIR